MDDSHIPARDELLRLVTSLPEESLPAAHAMLTELQTWPPPIPDEIRTRADAWAEMLELRADDLQQRAHRAPGGGMAFGHASGIDSFSTAPHSGWESRNSFSYDEDGASVYETTITKWGCEFTLIERMRRDSENRQTLFTLELTGPGQPRARHEHRFAIP
jgi:hypothetical protein